MLKACLLSPVADLRRKDPDFHRAMGRVEEYWYTGRTVWRDCSSNYTYLINLTIMSRPFQLVSLAVVSGRKHYCAIFLACRRLETISTRANGVFTVDTGYDCADEHQPTHAPASLACISGRFYLAQNSHCSGVYQHAMHDAATCFRSVLRLATGSQFTNDQAKSAKEGQQ